MVAFIVVSYNEADTIVRTLNSIKYQIDNYAKGRDIQLIIADDCSTDGTADVAARWLDDNGELFKSVKILPAEKNVGTCKNLGKAFRELDTEYFLVIAGDDAISKHDLFRKLNLLDDCDILLNGKLLFDADKLTIIRNRKKYLDTTMQSCEGYGFMRLISGVGCPIQNGAIYKRSLITEDVLQYMERFRLLDDRTRYHVILRKQKLKVKYDNEPILIYGVSNRSVTSVDGGHLSGMAKDLDDFYKVQIADSGNPISRGYLKYKRFISRYRKRSKIYYLDPYYVLMAFKLLFGYGKIQRCTNELLDKYADENEEYLRTL